MPSIANLSFYYDRSATISRMYKNAFRITNTYAGSNNIYFHAGYHYDKFFQAFFTDPILSNENGDINIYMPNRNSLVHGTDIGWSPQFIILDGFSLEEGEDYQVSVTITYSEEFRMDQEINLIFGDFNYNEVKQIKQVIQPAQAGDEISYGIQFLDYGADIENAFVMLHTGLMDPGTLTISGISVRQIIDNQYYPIANKNSWEMTRNTIKYSTDNGMTWTESSPDTELLCTLGENESVLIIGDNDSYYGDGFYSSQTCNVSGNLASLLSSTNFNSSTWLNSLTLKDQVFARLFSYDWPDPSYHYLKVVDASELQLPIPTGESGATYQGIFRGTPLVNAPKLPALSLYGFCKYAYMFAECHSLAQAPDLPSLRVPTACYYAMFHNCTSLVVPAKQEENPTYIDRLCYAFMYDGCTSLRSTPMFNILSLTNSCYMGMFKGCTSLTMVPYLNATTVAPYCYYEMFKGCNNIQAAPYLAPITNYGQESSANSYVHMFEGCTSLNYINYQVAEYNNNNWSYSDWVKNVAPTGVFVKSSTAQYWPINQDYGIPIGWTLVDEDDIPEGALNLYVSQITEYTDGTLAPAVGTISAASLNNVISGSCFVVWGTEVTVSFNLNNVDYDFIGWYEQDSENPNNMTLVSNSYSYTFAITHDTLLHSYCVQRQPQPTLYHYYVEADPSNGGTVLGGGSYENRQGVTISATPALGYEFSRWYIMNGNTKETVFTVAQYSFMAGPLLYADGTTLYAEFVEQSTPVVYYQLSATIDPAGYGTVSGTGMYQENITATITATPESGYKFLYWEEGGNILSNNRTYSLLMNSNHSLTAHFDLADESIIDYYSSKYFTIESLRDNNTILIDFGAGYPNGDIPQNHENHIFSLSYDYSIDNGETWNTVTIYNMHVANRDTRSYLGSPPNNMSISDYKKQFDPYNVDFGIPSNQNCFSITVNRGDNILIRANMPWYYDDGFWRDSDNELHSAYMWPYFRVQSSDNTPRTFNLSGNILSLIKGSNFRNYTSFDYNVPSDLYELSNWGWQFFYFGAANSVSKLILPQETFQYCYNRMFKYPSQLNKPANCGVIDAPILLATTLAHYCYREMFAWCTDIITAPELPATTLGGFCYNGMFYGCTSLVNPPELPATTLSVGCYAAMFSGCTSLTTAPELPATTITDYCYNGMFNGCTSLTTAPELLGVLQSNDNGTIRTYVPLACYTNMFKGCTSLVNPPSILPAQYALSTGCYAHMFEGCTSLTTAPELPAISVGQNAYGSMFEGCTSLTSITLPATDIYYMAYNRIFFGCHSLSTIRAYFTSWYDPTAPSTRGNNPNELYYNNIAYWNTGLPDNGSYYKNASANYDPITSACIPQGWTIYYTTP